MKIKMLKDKAGTANAIGSVSMTYEAGVTYDMEDGWGKALAETFIDGGYAEAVGKIEKKVVKPKETKKVKSEKKEADKE